MSRSAVDQLKSSALALDEASIDRLYGLEPVFEPVQSEAYGELGVFVELPCPWCGEIYGSMLDLTDASRCYIEDCQVCCRPIEVTLQVDEDGVFRSLSTRQAQ